MLSLRPYLIRMIGFLLSMAAVAAVLRAPLMAAFNNNVALNGLIAAVLLFGICLSCYNLLRLRREIRWLDCYDNAKDHLPGTPQPRVLAPLAILLKDNATLTTLPTLTVRSLLASIEGRLDENRDITRYLIGLLIFLGLLGTFWGLSQTISAIANVIHGINMGGADFSKAFQDLKAGLQSPLAGMGTAFSCSLLGLSGSLIIGFLDLQTSKAANAFYHHLEERLTMVTRLSGTEEGSIAHSGPAYSLSLFEQAVEGMNQLQNLIRRNEENRTSMVMGLQMMTEKLSSINEQLMVNQALVKKLTDSLSVSNFGLNDSLKQHLRNLDATSLKLLEETVDGRNRLSTEIRNEIRLVARTISALADGQDIAAA